MHYCINFTGGGRFGFPAAGKAVRRGLEATVNRGLTAAGGFAGRGKPIYRGRRCNVPAAVNILLPRRARYTARRGKLFYRGGHLLWPAAIMFISRGGLYYLPTLVNYFLN